MKKVILIIGLCFLAVGIILSATSFAMVNFNLEELSTVDKYTEKSYETEADGIIKITLLEHNRKVNVLKSEDDKIHIKYFENDKETYDITRSDSGELYISENSNLKWYEYISINFFTLNTYIEIQLPEELQAEIVLQTYNGEMVVEELSTDKAVTLETKNGKLRASHIKASALSCTSHNGKVECTNADVDNKASFETSNGSVSVKDIKCSDANLRSSNGSIYLEELDGDNIKLTTSNGQIRGSVCGSQSDFSIKSHTSNGSTNLPSNWGGGAKSLEANSSNGSISINFTQG